MHPPRLVTGPLGSPEPALAALACGFHRRFSVLGERQRRSPFMVVLQHGLDLQRKRIRACKQPAHLVAGGHSTCQRREPRCFATRLLERKPS